MITFFPRNIHWSSLFARKAIVNTERVPLGHPIILHKSKKFNMAAVLVKRSIDWSWTNWSWTVIYRHRNDSDYMLQLCCCQYVILIHWNLHEMKVLLYWAVNLSPPISHHWLNNFKPDQSVGHFPPIIVISIASFGMSFLFSLVERVKEPIWGILHVFYLQIAALDYANKLIVKYLPGLKVFPAVGNHEGAPVNRLIKFIHW